MEAINLLIQKGDVINMNAALTGAKKNEDDMEVDSTCIEGEPQRQQGIEGKAEPSIPTREKESPHRGTIPVSTIDPGIENDNDSQISDSDLDVKNKL
ncbi:hypothetical protein BB560_005330 [Smittium megazygosporum]|uniref:Uncharacterized protein n=1 Tax=Smittium megazygosporum TaxID=133381 RepID=A0A2T9Z6S6_9FUNG|nr:hypothetical protein BB560_005330 [Smittium megazygosporum]